MSLPATATVSPGSANTVSTAAPMNVFGRQHFMSRRDPIMQARGTMSMPTSPLGRDGVSMWEELMVCFKIHIRMERAWRDIMLTIPRVAGHRWLALNNR